MSHANVSGGNVTKPETKKRLDLLLVEKGLTPSRQQAQALILAGKVLANGFLETKPGTLIPPTASLEVKPPPPYVGRGGIKLEKALQELKISPKDKVCLDIGASTGGFTDCLLQHFAKKVYAVDVGKGQLAWKLRQDPRVIGLEKVNARYLSAKEIPEKIQLCTIDVSFISAKKILPPLKNLLSEAGEIILLLKPQFEAGPQKAKKGIVSSKKTHQEVLEDFLGWAVQHEFYPEAVTFSPITGADGNIEFLFAISLEKRKYSGLPDILSLVEQAHQALRP